MATANHSSGNLKPFVTPHRDSLVVSNVVCRYDTRVTKDQRIVQPNFEQDIEVDLDSLANCKSNCKHTPTTKLLSCKNNNCSAQFKDYYMIMSSFLQRAHKVVQVGLCPHCFGFVHSLVATNDRRYVMNCTRFTDLKHQVKLVLSDPDYHSRHPLLLQLYEFCKKIDINHQRILDHKVTRASLHKKYCDGTNYW